MLHSVTHRPRITPRVAILILAALWIGCRDARVETVAGAPAIVASPEFALAASTTATPALPPDPEPAAPTVSLDLARWALYGDAEVPEHSCPEGDDPRRCLVAAFYGDDPASQELALALFDEFGGVAGVEEEYELDGGFRGMIRIVPERPVGSHREHLRWVLEAQRDIAAFLGGLAEHADRPLAFRHAPIVWRFFRSVGRTTPSMMAYDWEVAYNVSGSLNRTSSRVREGLVHEFFHLNDRGGWSRTEIGYAVDGIVDRCGTDVDCLKPYAPHRTKVRGGTYYAFQPDNGDIAREYAAELATRYFLEQRAALAGEPLTAPSFKCGPWENARAWQALTDEFFGGADLVPDCPPGP